MKNKNSISGRRVQNSIVVHVCQINFFHVFIVPEPILRHLGEIGKIRLLPVKIHDFSQIERSFRKFQGLFISKGRKK